MQLSILTQNNHLLINRSVHELVIGLRKYGIDLVVYRTSATAKGKATGKLDAARDLLRTFGLRFLLSSLVGYFHSYFVYTDRRLCQHCTVIDVPDSRKLDPALFRQHSTEFGALLILSGTRIIKRDVLDLFAGNVLNVHSSLLPYAKGLMPALWTYVQGRGMGVTLFKLDEGIDTGEIVYQVAIARKPGSYAEHLVLTKRIGVELLTTWVLENMLRIRHRHEIESTYNKYPTAQDVAGKLSV